MNTPDEIIKNVQDFIEISFLKYGGRPFPITTDALKALLTMPTCTLPTCSHRLTAGDVFIDLETRFEIAPSTEFGD